MASDAQIAEWLRKARKKATRLQLFNSDTDILIYEWTLEDMPENHIECAVIIAETAQAACNRAQTGDQMYRVKVRNEEGKVTGNLVLEVAIDPNHALQQLADQQGGFAGIALTQILQHRNKDQQQQHHATQAALKIVLDTNAALMVDRRQTNALLFDLLSKVFELRLAQVQATEEGDQTVIQEAWAVQLDKVTDGAIKELLPRLGDLLDEGTKTLLANAPKKKGGRPRKTKQTNGAQTK